MKQTTYKSPQQDTSSKREESVAGSGLKQNDIEFQSRMLEGVSRTFALTIPQLPDALRHVVSNAYLLCRTVDTIEDEPSLSSSQKGAFSQLFIEILDTEKNPKALSESLGPLLSNHTIPAEHELISKVEEVVRIYKSFEPDQQQALSRCVRIMTEGMVYFQEHASAGGLKDQPEMDKYCYYVAGVVGEMLTELYCLYSPEIAKSKAELMKLSVSFGQGLQMTNILKDIWDDYNRGACWLPRNLFEQKGLQLEKLDKISEEKAFQDGMKHLVGIAHYHLENALKYTLLIPTKETGIREFCLWALGMAMLTLRKLNANLGFTESSQVKISRNSVKATVVISGLAVRNNTLLKYIFSALGTGLPKIYNE